ncbi:Condensin complex subunit, partial [Lunasporangiospora selenospora]
MPAQFELDEELSSIQQDTIHISREIPIEGENQKTLERILNEIVDILQESSYNITDSTLFDQIRSFVKYDMSFNAIFLESRLVATLSGFNTEIVSTAQDLDANDQEAYLHHRDPLEMYGFLVFWIISVTEQKATSRATVAEKAGKAT